jgi:hypothetical protein
MPEIMPARAAALRIKTVSAFPMEQQCALHGTMLEYLVFTKFVRLALC